MPKYLMTKDQISFLPPLASLLLNYFVLITQDLLMLAHFSTLDICLVPRSSTLVWDDKDIILGKYWQNHNFCKLLQLIIQKWTDPVRHKYLIQ